MYTYNIVYEYDGRRYKTDKKINPHFHIEDSFDGRIFRAEIITEYKIKISKFQIVLPFEFCREHKIFVNGYQSWTESREYGINEKMSEFKVLKEMIVKSPFNKNSGMGRAGDVFFYDYPRKKGVFYGYSYGYARNDREIDLFASLSERNGFTIVKFNVKKAIVTIEKDFEGVTFSGKMPIAEFVHIRDEYDNAFDCWFSLMNIKCIQKIGKSGYTTWYNHYRNINEDIVSKELEALSALPQKLDIFQIDDGYQSAVGDWLNADENKFPKGMKTIADDIHSKGMLAGLWLAPFAAAKNSFIYNEHKDWLVYDSKGCLYNAGANWGGFYAVDFNNPDAAEYIKKVFDTVLNIWGYDMVKLDFLYAACMVPAHNKSRGQLMCEAMDFIRECVGDKLILGCGVPLMPCFGKVDFCRIGADVALEWKYDRFAIREDVSTPNTICCSVFRRHLNNRAFMNDPDVFILRDENNDMSFEQRKLITRINSMFGNLLFVSDDVSCYNSEQIQAFIDAINKKEIKITKAELDGNDIISVDFYLNAEAKKLSFNYKSGEII